MIEEVKWTCECGYKNVSIVYDRKFTVRCKQCMATYAIKFEAPEVRKLIGGYKVEDHHGHKAF